MFIHSCLFTVLKSRFIFTNDAHHHHLMRYVMVFSTADSVTIIFPSSLRSFRLCSSLFRMISPDSYLQMVGVTTVASCSVSWTFNQCRRSVPRKVIICLLFTIIWPLSLSLITRGCNERSGIVMTSGKLAGLTQVRCVGHRSC